MSSAAPQTRDVLRQEVQEAMAKTAELRVLHAALLHGGGGGGVGNPATLGLPLESSSLSLSRASHPFTPEDYPVFRPSYEEEPLPAYHRFHSKSQTLLETLGRIGLEMEEDGKGDVSVDEKETTFSSVSRGGHMFSTPDSEKSFLCSCADDAALQKTSTATDTIKCNRRSLSAEFKAGATCNRCKPATINRGADFEHKLDYKRTISAVQGSAPHHPSLQLHKNKRLAVLSWLFPQFNRKPKSDKPPTASKPEDKSRNVEDRKMCSLRALKKELVDAHEMRDAALVEVGEMKSSLEVLKQKLLHLEAYCQELKQALIQTMRGKDARSVEKHIATRRNKTTGSSIASSLMPVSHEVMLEGFLQMVSEARLSVKQFCKTIISQSEETDVNMIERLSMLTRPNDLTLNSRCRHSKELQYHLEALMNQALHQDFENCMFQLNGSQRNLDPNQDCLENFSAFVSLRSLSWKEVLSESSFHYSEDFTRFCDQKMGTVVSVLGWPRPWPEQLCQSFFLAAKCIWLLHLLAFSFRPPLAILRVGENRSFDPLFMEDTLLDRQRAQAPAHVKITVTPGFYVQDRVVRCKVLCNYGSVV